MKEYRVRNWVIIRFASQMIIILDLKWEMFLKLDELISLTAFGK
jgi:hypothetical protein